MPGRAVFSTVVQNARGDAQSTTPVTVYEEDGTTLLEQPMYSAESGGVVLANPLSPNSLGFVKAYVDRPQRCVFTVGGVSYPGEFSPDVAAVGTDRRVDITAVDYGAVGDGNTTLESTAGTDDTAAIQAAVDAAGTDAYVSFNVHLPAGVFNINDLRLPPGTKLIGSGIDMTVLKRTAARVTSVKVTNSGSLYLSVPTVTISGGGGSGATATATVTAGRVTKITLTAQGSGYTSDPSVTIAASDGGGVQATAEASCAFISEKESSSGAQGICFEDLSIDGNNLGTHGIALGYSSQAGGYLYGGSAASGDGVQWGTRAYMRDVLVKNCPSNGARGLKLHANVADLDHVWLLENFVNLSWEGTNLKAWQLNTEGASSYEIIHGGGHGVFKGTQIEISAGDNFTGTDAVVLFTSAADYNVFESFFSTPDDFGADLIQLESGSVGNRVFFTTEFGAFGPDAGKYMLSDENNASIRYTMDLLRDADTSQPTCFSYEQPMLRVAPGHLVLNPLGFPLTNDRKTLTAAQDTAAHPTIDNPVGVLFITDELNNTAEFSLEGSTTTLQWGSSSIYAGGISATGGRVSVYVTGGDLHIANGFGGTKTFLLWWLIGGSV